MYNVWFYFKTGGGFTVTLETKMFDSITETERVIVKDYMAEHAHYKTMFGKYKWAFTSEYSIAQVKSELRDLIHTTKLVIYS